MKYNVRIHLLLLLFLMALTGVSEIGAAAGTRSSGSLSSKSRLNFNSEIIRIYIEEDSVRVDGLYYLLCDFAKDPNSHATLFYPYPEDSLLGGARTLLLEIGATGFPTQPARFEESKRRCGANWWVPMLADTIVVRTVYRQARLTNYARYIVTTTKAWGQPLMRARFEIHLPDEAEEPKFSFPFSRSPDAASNTYFYETTNFMPDLDIIVVW